MRISTTRLDVTYEGRFAQPSLDFATAPSAVLKSLVKSVTSRFTVSSRDISVTPSYRVDGVRLRVILFNGQGTFEVDADKVGANFRNALLKDDVQTIQDCLTLGLDGILAALTNDRIVDHTIRVMMFIEFLDEPKNGLVFLNSIASQRGSGVVQKLPKSEDVGYFPALKFELSNEQEKWLFTFELQRAYRAPQELFMSATLACADGNRLGSVAERWGLLESILGSTWSDFGLEVADKK